MLAEHRLPPAYLDSALKWFAPLSDTLAQHQKSAGAPLLVGINGSQGSGKTTACDYLRRRLHCEWGLSVVVMSLDDFYLTRAERDDLARTVHPLLRTRGVPGTHDLPLLQQVLAALRAGERPDIPRFDKAADDRLPRHRWQAPASSVDVILLEGWCMGTPPQSADQLDDPVNALEREEDAGGCWRAYVNNALATYYLPLYAQVDYWAMLRAPSFDCVYRWRLEQEHKLAQAVTAGGGDDSKVMNEAEVARFIQFYQRLTQHGLTVLPGKMHCTLALDERRAVQSVRWRSGDDRA
jgi:D-glycerate 3-kinase